MARHFTERDRESLIFERLRRKYNISVDLIASRLNIAPLSYRDFEKSIHNPPQRILQAMLNCIADDSLEELINQIFIDVQAYQKNADRSRKAALKRFPTPFDDRKKKKKVKIRKKNRKVKSHSDVMKFTTYVSPDRWETIPEHREKIESLTGEVPSRFLNIDGVNK